MTEGELRDLLDALDRLLRPHLEKSEPLRRVAGHIGRWLIARAEAAARTEEPPIPLADESAVQSRPEAPSTAPAIELAATVPIEPIEAAAPVTETAPPLAAGVVPLRIGDAQVQVEIKGTPEEIGRARTAAEAVQALHPSPAPERRWPGADLATIAQRSRLKAESCRFLVERRAAAGDPEREGEFLDRVADLITRGKALPNCFLWSIYRQRVQPSDADMGIIAGCYDALADAAALVARIDERGDGPVEEGFSLLAEADSALRVALEASWLTEPDADQDDAHLWLRRQSEARRVYVPRFMRIGDRADPASAADLRRRIAEVADGLDARARQGRAVGSALSKIEYHARRVTSATGEDAAHDWRKIAEALAGLEAVGVPPNHRRVSAAIAPALGVRPAPADDDGPIERALAAARLASERPDPEEPASASRRWSERVAEVRGLLEGRRMVVIGGQRNPEAVERFEDAFGLSECEWVELTEHGSGRSMGAPILRPDTALVLVLIKLAGHLHVNEARELARDAGKPCVALTAGYNPEQAAEAILEQAGERLRGAARAM